MPYTLSLVFILPLALFTSPVWSNRNCEYSDTSPAACVINLSCIQKAVRTHQNINDLKPGVALDVNLLNEIFANIETGIPICPSGGSYTFSKIIPPQGTPAAKCDHPEHQSPPDRTKDL